MKSTTYNQLSIFHAIVQEGSINGAARKLLIAAPSVSQALKTLEKNIGQTLFYRTTRSLELTESGSLLFERTFALSQKLNLALESIKELNESPSGKISLSLPRFVMQHYFKPIYGEFCRLYPDIELEISVDDATVDIIKEGIDFSIRFGSKLELGMVAKQLTPPWHDALFASSEYIKLFGYPKSIEDLKNHKLIQYRFISSNKIAPLVLKSNEQTITVEVPTSLIVNDTDIMIDAAMQGIGIGRIVEPVITEHLKRGTLMPILKDNWLEIPGLFLCYPQNSQRLKRNQLFVDFLTKHFGKN